VNRILAKVKSCFAPLEIKPDLLISFGCQEERGFSRGEETAATFATAFRMSLALSTIDASLAAASFLYLGHRCENQNSAHEAPAAIRRDAFSRRAFRRFKLDAGTNCLLVPCERMFRAISAGVGGFGGRPPGLTANEPMKAFPNSLACVTYILKLRLPSNTY